MMSIKLGSNRLNGVQHGYCRLELNYSHSVVYVLTTFIPCIFLTFIYMIVLVNNDNPGATSFQMDLSPNLAVLYRQNINLSSNSCGYFYLN